jgi:hypothetical protein
MAKLIGLLSNPPLLKQIARMQMGRSIAEQT